MDSSKLASLLATEYGGSAEDRLVGTTHRGDSAYFDIVRFFGPNAVSPDRVKVVHRPMEFRLEDERIAVFAREVEARMRNEGRLYRGPLSLKLVSYALTGPAPELAVQPVNYGLQAATCFALDLPHPAFRDRGGTLRDYWYTSRPDQSIEHNPLAVCLGVCGYLLIREREKRFLLQVTRSAKLASLENTLGPSAAGVVDYRNDYSNLEGILRISLKAEVLEELRLTESEYRILPLGWAMEIFRGDRPQLFALIETELTRAEVAARMTVGGEQGDEHSAVEFVELGSDGGIPDALFARLNPEARMNLLLIEEYLGDPDGVLS